MPTTVMQHLEVPDLGAISAASDGELISAMRAWAQARRIVDAGVTIEGTQRRDEHKHDCRKNTGCHAFARRDTSPTYSRSRYANQSKSAGVAVPARS